MTSASAAVTRRADEFVMVGAILPPGGDQFDFPACHRMGCGAYFVDPNPSAHENSRNSSFGADIFLYVRTEVKGSTSAFGSVTVIRSSRTPGDVNLMRSRTVNWSL